VYTSASGAWLRTSRTAKALDRLAKHVDGGRGYAHDRLAVPELRRLVGILSKLKPAKLGELGVDEGRIDTIAVGAVVLLTLTELLGFPAASVSKRSLREGVVLRELARVKTATRFQAVTQAS
jgi:exopolyphosphatase/pppGpp-phosphohydrolase